jgi:hypothetical protein
MSYSMKCFRFVVKLPESGKMDARQTAVFETVSAVLSGFLAVLSTVEWRIALFKLFSKL